MENFQYFKTTDDPCLKNIKYSKVQRFHFGIEMLFYFEW